MILKSSDLESTGKDITMLQEMLKERGYRIREISGVFDSGTKSALRAFQNDNNLTPTGILDDKTWSYITENMNSGNSNTRISQSAHEAKSAKKEQSGVEEIIEDITKKEKENEAKAQADTECKETAEKANEMEHKKNAERANEMEHKENAERANEMEHKENAERARAMKCTEATDSARAEMERKMTPERARGMEYKENAEWAGDMEHKENAERARAMRCTEANARARAEMERKLTPERARGMEYKENAEGAGDMERKENAEMARSMKRTEANARARAEMERKMAAERARGMECKEENACANGESSDKNSLEKDEASSHRGKTMHKKRMIEDRCAVIDPAKPWEHTSGIIPPSTRPRNKSVMSSAPMKKECVVPEVIQPPTFSPITPKCSEISVASYEDTEDFSKMQSIFEKALSVDDAQDSSDVAVDDMQDTFDDAVAAADTQDTFDNAVAAADTQDVFDDAVATADTQDTSDNAVAVADTQNTFDDAVAVADTQNTSDNTVAVADTQNTSDNAVAVADTQDVSDDTVAVADTQDTFDDAPARMQGRSPSWSNEQKTLQWGSRNSSVHILQHRLTELGYFLGIVNGQFGFETRRAVIDFQRDRGLMPMGVVDASTWEALQRAERNT